jgi:hypothetical protein
LTTFDTSSLRSCVPFFLPSSVRHATGEVSQSIRLICIRRRANMSLPFRSCLFLAAAWHSIHLFQMADFRRPIVPFEGIRYFAFGL